MKPDRFDWNWMLHEHKALIQHPYEVSTMSIFEQYSCGIPLFFPSKQFYKQMVIDKQASIASYNGTYWKPEALPQEYESTKSLDWWLIDVIFMMMTNRD